MPSKADEIEQDTTTAAATDVDAETALEEGAEGGDGGEGEDEPDPKDAAAPLTVNLDGDDADEDDSDLPPVDDPKAGIAWKGLKKTVKQLERENAELRAKTSPAATPPTVKQPGARPSLKDHGNDEDAHAKAVIAWVKDIDAFEAAKQKQQDESDRIATAYREKIQKLGREDYKAQERIVDAVLSPAQATILLKKTKDTATLVYGLGKNPAKLRALAAITDEIDFAIALADVERTMKITKRTPQTPPETVVRGQSGGKNFQDATLARLRAKADQTGNRTEVIAYRRKLRDQQSKK